MDGPSPSNVSISASTVSPLRSMSLYAWSLAVPAPPIQVPGHWSVVVPVPSLPVTVPSVPMIFKQGRVYFVLNVQAVFCKYFQQKNSRQME